MAKVFSSIVKDQIINHHPEMLIFQGGLIKLILSIYSFMLWDFYVCLSAKCLIGGEKL